MGQGCLKAFSGFIAGAVVGGFVTVVAWNIIYPTSSPSYGDGIGWGMALFFFWAPMGAVLGGIIGATIAARK